MIFSDENILESVFFDEPRASRRKPEVITYFRQINPWFSEYVFNEDVVTAYKKHIEEFDPIAAGIRPLYQQLVTQLGKKILADISDKNYRGRQILEFTYTDIFSKMTSQERAEAKENPQLLIDKTTERLNSSQ